MDNGRLNRKLLILLCVPGIVGLFLPFTYGYSSLSAIRYDELYVLAGPFFLSIVIFAWQIRRLFRPTISALEAVWNT
jgi:hypothetical protein